MAYPELLQALADEVDRRERDVRDGAIRRRETLLAEARARADAIVAQAAAGERDRLDALASSEREGREREAGGVVLAAAHEELARVKAEACARLATLDDEALLQRLIDEVCGEIGGGGATVFVAPPMRFRAERFVVGAKRRVEVDDSIAGAGVRAETADGRTLDDTLRSRLESAWRDLEPEIAGILFGGAP